MARRKSTTPKKIKNDLDKKYIDIIFEFPREEDLIKLKLNIDNIDLYYLANLIDISSSSFPNIYKPLFNKILEDLPKLVSLCDDSYKIDIDKLSLAKPYTDGIKECNPLTFKELKTLIDKLLSIFSIAPSNDYDEKILEYDVTNYYDNIHKPDNTLFLLKNGDLLVFKIEPLDFLDSAEIIDKIQAQQVENQLAEANGRRPKHILTQEWLFNILLPELPTHVIMHPKSPVVIDISKIKLNSLIENPLSPFEINKVINTILTVSGIIDNDVNNFRG